MTEHGYIPHLSPDSYTSLRLQHATPEHLHLTTRRCFIGPIPQGWLRHHRRDWYRHHLHINYSSRAATFHATPGTGRHRRVSQLENTTLRRQSFPQPQNLQVEDEGEEEREDGEAPADTVVESPVIMSIPVSSASKEYGKVQSQSISGSGMIEDAQGNTSENGPSKSISTPASAAVKRKAARVPTPLAPSVRTKASRRTSNLSFVTAKEHLSRVDVDGQDESEEEEEEPSRVIAQTSQSGDGAIEDPPSWKPQLDVVAASGNYEQQPKPGLMRKLKAKVTGQAENSLNMITQADGQRTKTGVVRFALPEDEAQRDRFIKRRMAQVSRLATLNRVKKDKIGDGEIIKLEKMLVRVEYTDYDLPPDFDENDSQKIDSRTIDKWKEFMVVCRESSREGADFSLVLYKSRVIKATEQTQIKSQSAYEIFLNRKTVGVGLFSSLDKSIVLWEPYKHGHRYYILKPQSAANSMEWFTFLRELVGHKRSDILNVSIPDLGVHLVLDHPFQEIESSRGLTAASDGDEEALAETLKQEEAAARKIVKRCMDLLDESPEWTDIFQTWAIPATSTAPTSPPAIASGSAQSRVTRPKRQTANIERDLISSEPMKRSSQFGHQPVGLAWKRYDRLEWVHGANEKRMYGTIGMARSHELELRPKQHYPTTTKDKNGQQLVEPPPVEGFLIRLTSQKGRNQKLGKLFYKRLYFSTHNQYLVFNRPAQAEPPPPPNLPLSKNSKVPNSSAILEGIPLIYSVNPYQLQDNQIAWLNGEPNAQEDVIQNDRHAFDEAERVINLLLKCDGNINLCHVVKVRKVHRGAVAADDNVEEGDEVDFHEDLDEETQQDDGTTQVFDDERTFELLMRNGLVVRLQTYNKTTKKEWMKRLRDLVKYWTMRCAADIQLYKTVRQQNLDSLNIDADLEALMGQFGRKWEVTKSYASPELYNICGISACRTVTMSGTLFRKARMHATFVRNLVILSHGHLMIFRDTLRTASGKKLPHIHHERLTSIDLKDCYVYSGLITDSELLYRDRGPDAARLGFHQGLPRMYLEDGWTSTDEDTMTCFVLWHGKRSSWFRGGGDGAGDAGAEAGSGGGGLVGKGRRLRKVSRLGVEGKSIVFKARSRAERDHWVMNVSMEIERLVGGDEVRIVV